jgi:spermidine synthase
MSDAQTPGRASDVEARERRPRVARTFLLLAFFASGASAIVCQVVWQRILTAHGGMDAHSTVTTVAAFMLGLGLGNLAGGALGDRLGPARCLAAYLLLEAGIAALAWSSPYLLYDLYGVLAPHLRGAWEKFAVELALLLLPTMLMGATLPVAARALVRTGAETAAVVGRLYGANTLGAACGGALMSGPLVLGRVGLSGALGLAAALNGLAAALVLATLVSSCLRWRSSGPAELRDAAPPAWTRPVFAWTALYALTGFISLSLETLWFRVLQVLLLGTTFTFPALLALFLLGLGSGSWAGGALAGRLHDPKASFLHVQFAIPQIGLLGPMLLFAVVRAMGLPGFGARWAIAALVVAPPAFLMGASFPILERVVARDVETLGRHTGALLFANTAGAFVGVTLTGLLLLDRLGTPRTLAALAALGFSFELAAWHRAGRTRAATWRLAAAGLVVAALVGLHPAPRPFWAALHASEQRSFHAREDDTCVAALKLEATEEGVQGQIAANGKWQNPYPFFAFHMNLGLLPALIAERPERALVIGLGIGSTAVTQAAEPRIRSLDVVEICSGEERLLREHLRGLPEFDRLFGDPRARFHVADGRRFLLLAEERFDLIVTDTLLPAWSGSGSLYSADFYRLAAARLAPGGMLAQWMATPRTTNTAASVFPHVVKLRGPSLRSGILLMSQDPIHVDSRRVLLDLERLGPRLSRREAAVARRALSLLEVSRVREGGPPPLAPDGINTDLFPRDEYSDNWLLRQIWRARPAPPEDDADPPR